jgi:hypothetical protein
MNQQEGWHFTPPQTLAGLKLAQNRHARSPLVLSKLNHILFERSNPRNVQSKPGFQLGLGFSGGLLSPSEA